ncbi:MAG: glycosyltransferase [Gammaproteobacteria bacterium]|jgi:O-antigen biosynthesis protein|nr:glycosyltransferase [Gammaproteobacteria bacterium]MBT5223308.1 glycosyltransferase [Gammaproteobacteria bacterium]MBT5827020.1 glycosyltransferase [Gammaproteobacteria bacterium]MBT5967147.1 glycosyltransferase [Gammaproteobacteria bacterium]MBT6420026.1 glycosyltransferase [Gammaproteobacteria bacterium]
MENKRWDLRLLRKLINIILKPCLRAGLSWQWLRFYPAIIPAQQCFAQWQLVNEHECPGYQSWVDKNSLGSLTAWKLLQQQALHWQSAPKISIVTPVYNVGADVLYECILSVRAQAYPYWQLVLVDDGSTRTETHKLLKSAVCKDPRIEVYFNKQSQGISRATNLAIAKAQGDYVVFLDHDDRLALDALFLIAEQIQRHPEIDIIYSDRDMISPFNARYMHLFKPDWSPETLLSGNYVFHLMCYRRSLLNQLGGLRADFDGSQDYDLVLRAAETNPQVKHIAKVLYHWRQYQGSVSLDSGAKDYAFEAGIKALNQAMQRRKIAGTASEIKSLWRGNYQLDLVCPDRVDIDVISLDSALAPEDYTRFINQAVEESGHTYIALISQALIASNENSIAHLAAWLTMDSVGMAAGGILTDHQLINYAGATYAQDGSVLIPYQCSSVDEPGYMAVTHLVRNISAPHPFCVLIRRQLWQQLDGLDSRYLGFYSLLDFSLRAQAVGKRCVSVPQAQFITAQPEILNHYPKQDKALFSQQWQAWLEKGDPYYNQNLNRDSQDKLYYLPD